MPIHLIILNNGKKDSLIGRMVIKLARCGFEPHSFFNHIKTQHYVIHTFIQ